MARLRVNLNDVADWLRSLPQETQFDMSSCDQCLFASYLQAVHPNRDIYVNVDYVTLDGRMYSFDRRAIRIILKFWDEDLPEEVQIIGRDEALSVVEEVLRLEEEATSTQNIANCGEAVVN
jgi:hypothetical protein